MTRINSGIKPSDLTNKHLFAEYREIIRIPNAVLKNLNKNKNRNLPEEFKLGTNHVLYFYNKIQYLHNRFLSIKNELKKRNYNNLSINDESFLKLKYEANMLYNDININEQNKHAKIVVHRIIDRLPKKIIMNNIELTKEQYIKNVSKYF